MESPPNVFVLRGRDAGWLRKRSRNYLRDNAMFRRLSLLMLTTGSLLAPPCLADDAEDATNLLSEALKCPNPIQKNVYDTPKHFVDTDFPQIVEVTRETNKSMSTSNLLRIENLVERNTTAYSNSKTSLTKTRSVLSAPFGKLDVTSIGTDRHGVNRYLAGVSAIVLHCNRAAGRCINISQSETWCNRDEETCPEGQLKPYSASEEVALEVCDDETAKNAKFAIDTLVKMNQSTATASKDHSVGVPTGYAMRDNRDAEAGDIKTLKDIDLSSCADNCSKADKCKGFSYDKWNRFCFLKSELASLRLDPKSISGIANGVSMPAGIDEQARMVAYRNKAFPGDGYTQIGGKDVKACALSCEQSLSCVAYTFLKDSNTCKLFKTTEVYSSNPRADSGVKTQSK